MRESDGVVLASGSEKMMLHCGRVEEVVAACVMMIQQEARKKPFAPGVTKVVLDTFACCAVRLPATTVTPPLDGAGVTICGAGANARSRAQTIESKVFIVDSLECPWWS